jgi:flagellar biogenesis protein FliO
MRNVYLLISCFFISFSSANAGNLKGLSQIKDITIYRSSGSFEVVFDFGNRFDAKTVKTSFKDGFLQIELPKTYVWPAKKTETVKNDKHIEKVFTYQQTRRSVFSRIYVKNSVKNLKNALSINSSPFALTVRVDRNRLETPVPVTVAKTTKSSGKNISPIEEFERRLSSNRPVSKVVTSKTPARSVPSEPVPAPVKKSESNSYMELWFKMVIALMGTLAFFALFVLGYKKFSMNKPNQINKDNLAINIVSSKFMGNKRSLSIVEVNSQRILIGMTPENISMICKLDDGGEITATPALETTEVPVQVSSDANVSGLAAKIRQRLSNVREMQ